MTDQKGFENQLDMAEEEARELADQDLEIIAGGVDGGENPGTFAPAPLSPFDFVDDNLDGDPVGRRH